MQTLRHAHFLIRFMLVWFALSIGAAIASPLVNPQAMELICSGSGVMKLAVVTDDGAQGAPGHTLDCPLCAAISAPPPVASQSIAPQPQPLAYALQSIPAAHIASCTAAPLPPRGPPVSS